MFEHHSQWKSEILLNANTLNKENIPPTKIFGANYIYQLYIFHIDFIIVNIESNRQ